MAQLVGKDERVAALRRGKIMTHEQKQNRKLWKKALRSGKYQQAQGTLKVLDENGDAYHCCLGVAEDLFGELRSENNTFVSADGGLGIPSNQTLDALAMSLEEASYFMGLNDTRRFSFRKIARRI